MEKKSIKKNGYMKELTNIIIFFLIFGMVLIACTYLMLVHYGKSNIDGSTMSAIADMQAATLTICGICITLLTVIISVLSFFREKKIEEDTLIIDESRSKIEHLETYIEKLLSINAIQFVDIRNIECYYDAIFQEIKNQKTDNSNSHFILYLYNIAVSMAEKSGNDEKLINCYEQIIKESNRIITNSTSTNLDKHFAYMEALNALYKRARHFLVKKPNDAQKDLENAYKLLEGLKEICNIDTFGHISNIEGLVYFWQFNIDINCYSTEELDIKRINHAIFCFQNAVKKNNKKIEFKNHLACALIKKYEYFEEESCAEEAKETLKSIISINDNYFKAHLNIASLNLKIVQKKLGINQYPFILVFPILKYTSDNYCFKEIDELIDEAIFHLKKSTLTAPEFIDNYYKSAEAYTYKFVFLKLNNSRKGMDLIKEISKCFELADKIAIEHLSCLRCKRNFYSLIGEETKARNINDKIKKITNSDAEIWLKKYESFLNYNK